MRSGIKINPLRSISKINVQIIIICDIFLDDSRENNRDRYLITKELLLYLKI